MHFTVCIQTKLNQVDTQLQANCHNNCYHWTKHSLRKTTIQLETRKTLWRVRQPTSQAWQASWPPLLVIYPHLSGQMSSVSRSAVKLRAFHFPRCPQSPVPVTRFPPGARLCVYKVHLHFVVTGMETASKSLQRPAYMALSCASPHLIITITRPWSNRRLWLPVHWESSFPLTMGAKGRIQDLDLRCQILSHHSVRLPGTPSPKYQRLLCHKGSCGKCLSVEPTRFGITRHLPGSLASPGFPPLSKVSASRATRPICTFPALPSLAMRCSYSLRHSLPSRPTAFPLSDDNDKDYSAL